MNDALSPDAKAIIEAGLAAGEAAKTTDAMVAADKAVERAAGEVGMKHMPAGDVKIVDSLIEIVQLYVRQQLSAKQVGSNEA